MKIFASEKEMYAFKRACADDGFGGVGRDLGISASTIHKIFKSGMDAEVRAVNIRNRVLEYITPYLSLADQKAKAQAEINKPPVDELGISLVPSSYDSDEPMKVDTSSIRREYTGLINRYLGEFSERQLAEVLYRCANIRSASTPVA